MQVQLDNTKDRILPILRSYNVKKVGLFGSTGASRVFQVSQPLGLEKGIAVEFYVLTFQP